MHAALLCFIPALAVAAVGTVRTRHAEAELIVQVSSIAPGDSFRAALRLRPEKNWHVYWSNPGDAGLPPKVKWVLPTGFSPGELEFQYPERMESPPLATFGYGGEAWFPAWITVDKGIKPAKKVMMRASVNWLICREEECLPEKTELEAVIDIGKTRLDGARAGAWREALAKLPVKSPVEWQAVFRERELELSSAMPSGWHGRSGHALFFPSDPGIVENAATQSWSEKNGRLVLILKRDAAVSARPDTLRGVVVLDSGRVEDRKRKAFRVGVMPGKLDIKGTLRRMP